MGSNWFTGGVTAASHGRIQFDFRLDGVRYRPTIKRPPSESNLRRARERLEVIKMQIEAGTFSFAAEFPDYRFLRRMAGVCKVRLCNEVFDEYLAHCEARVRRDDMAAATLCGYRKVLDGVWRPALGERLFYDVSYSQLVAIADQHDKRPVEEYFANVYFELLIHDIRARRFLLDMVGPSQILIGSNLGGWDSADGIQMLEELELPKHEHDMIAYLNAMKLFKLEDILTPERGVLPGGH